MRVGAILIAIVSTFDIAGAFAMDAADSAALRRHTRTEHIHTNGPWSDQLSFDGMDLVIAQVQQVPSSITELGLSKSDAALILARASDEEAFDLSVREESRRQMRTLCSRGISADAVALASAIKRVDEESESRRNDRYSTLFQSLSPGGRKQIKTYLAATTGSGSSATIDIVSLAAERPNLVKAGFAYRCSQLAKSENQHARPIERGPAQEIVAGQEDQP